MTGRNLRASVRIDLDSTRSPELGQLVAWVGELGPLTGVTMDAERLRIVVPGSLGRGVHALVVRETLSGETARLLNAVHVLDDGGEPEDGGVEALPSGIVDAATLPDADVLEARDGGVADPGPSSGGSIGIDANVQVDAAPGQCTGVSHGGVCWYLGEGGATCEQTCATHGGPAPEAAAFVGTPAQGGSSAQCAEILRLLGRGEAVIEASRFDVGIGCHLWGAEEQPFWLTSPAFAPTAGSSSARVVCGCSS